MKNVTNIVLWIFSLIAFSSYANTQTSELTQNNVGYQFSFESKVLAQSRDIQIYLPDDYNSSTKKYPVLYVIDSQQYFLHPIAYQNTLREEDETPGVIVVGIKMNSDTRRTLLYKQSDKFINFLAAELLPFIDSNYRTLPNERLYFGWEMAGGLALQLLAEKTDLFKGYLVSSATHFTDKRITAVEKVLTTNTELTKHFYFTLGSVESWSLPSHNKLAKLFENKAPKTMHWRYNLSKEDNHYSTPLITFNQGLKALFSDYMPIRFYSIKQFNDFGGMPALSALFKKRGQRYGLPTEIHPITKNYLLNLTVNNNDYENFTFFANEFAGIFAEYFHWEYAFNKYGHFYLSNNAPEKAMKVFSIGVKKFPNSATITSGLADSYRMLSNKEQAMVHYQKSLELFTGYSALEQDKFESTLADFDSSLSKIQTRLAALKN